MMNKWSQCVCCSQFHRALMNKYWCVAYSNDEWMKQLCACISIELLASKEYWDSLICEKNWGNEFVCLCAWSKEKATPSDARVIAMRGGPSHKLSFATTHKQAAGQGGRPLDKVWRDMTNNKASRDSIHAALRCGVNAATPRRTREERRGGAPARRNKPSWARIEGRDSPEGWGTDDWEINVRHSFRAKSNFTHFFMLIAERRQLILQCISLQ